MKIVNSIDIFREIVEKNSRSKSVKSNLFFVNKTIRQHIDDERLLYEESRGGVIFFVNEGEFMRGYYIWDTEHEFPDFKSEKTTIIEEFDKNNRRSKDINALANELNKMGFREKSANVGLSIDLSTYGKVIEKEFRDRFDTIKKMGYNLIFSRKEHVVQVWNLWKNFLDTTDLSYDNLDFIRSKDKKVICITNSKDEVCAATLYKIENNAVVGNYLVTDPRYYRNGFGSMVLLAWLFDGVRLGCVVGKGWINSDNIKSIELHEKMGFKKDGRINRQFILN